jgi:flavorubredoxin
MKVITDWVIDSRWGHLSSTYKIAASNSFRISDDAFLAIDDTQGHYFNKLSSVINKYYNFSMKS